MLSKKAQSTLEYVIILTAIIAAMIFAASSFIKPTMENSVNHVTDEVGAQVNRIHFGPATQ